MFLLNLQQISHSALEGRRVDKRRKLLPGSVRLSSHSAFIFQLSAFSRTRMSSAFFAALRRPKRGRIQEFTFPRSSQCKTGNQQLLLLCLFRRRNDVETTSKSPNRYRFDVEIAKSNPVQYASGRQSHSGCLSSRRTNRAEEGTRPSRNTNPVGVHDWTRSL